MDYKTIIGTITNEFIFQFNLDSNLLKIDAINSSLILFNDDWLHDDEIISNVIIGKTFADKKTIVFFSNSGFGRLYSGHSYRVDMIIIFDNDVDSFSNVKLEFEELKYIYNNNFIIKNTSNNNFFLDGSATLKINNYGSTDSRLGSFYMNNQKIFFQTMINRKFSSKYFDPIKLYPLFSLEFEEKTNDYDFLYNLIIRCKLAFSFFCNRRNIIFNNITLYKKNEKNLNYKIASVLLTAINHTKADEKTIAKKFIPYEYFKNIGTIFDFVENDKLYLSHIPNNEKESKITTPARFVMITAAFENEFKLSFPKGVKHNTKTINSRNKVREYLDLIPIPDDFNSDEKRILKKIKDSIFLDNLSSRIKFAIESNDDIAIPLCKYLCKLNGLDYKLNKICTEVEKIRNDYAHGNIIDEFSTYGHIGIIIIERLIYIMQLKRLGMSEHNIKQTINQLF